MLHEICILPRGKINMVKTGDLSPEVWVYQRTHPKKGNVGVRGRYGLQLRRRVIPVDPRTTPQMERRSKFSDAVGVWQSLAEDVKQQWRRAARSTHRSGYAHFLSAYMRYEGPPGGFLQSTPDLPAGAAIAAAADQAQTAGSQEEAGQAGLYLPQQQNVGAGISSTAKFQNNQP